MIYHFQAEPERAGFKLQAAIRVFVYPWVAAVLIGTLDFGFKHEFHWPPVFEVSSFWWAFLSFIEVISYFLTTGRRLLRVDLDADSILIFRELQTIPLLGRFFGPAQFPRRNWRIAEAKGGVVVRRLSAEIEFKWHEERAFLCSKASQPALKAWIELVQKSPITTDGQR